MKETPNIKPYGYGGSLLWIIRILGLILVNAFYFFMYLLAKNYADFSSGLSGEKQIYAILFVNLAFFISEVTFPHLTSTNIIHIDKIIIRALKFCILFGVVLTFFFTFTNLINNIPMQIWVFSCIIFTILYTCLHIGIRFLLKFYRRKGYNYKNVLIIGGDINALRIVNELKGSDYGYRIIGYCAPEESEILNEIDLNYLGNSANYEKIIEDQGKIDVIYCTINDNTDKFITHLISYTERHMIRLFIIPIFSTYFPKRFVLGFIDNLPAISLRNEPLQHLSNRFAKRAFDIVFSLLVLILVFPILLLILTPIIKLTSPGPIFFKQKRTGINGKSFDCYKFRSMKVNDDADKHSATKGDSRVTKIGAFMRKTSIDELPQFINVIKGEMSIVGPRPHMLKHTEEYSAEIEKFMVRHLVKPGITGWAQVCGFRGETKTVEDMENRVKRDVWYIENWTFILDLKIIFLTVFNIFRGEKMAY